MNLTAPARAILAFTIAVTLAVSGWDVARYAAASLADVMSVHERQPISVLVALVPLGLAIWSFLLSRGVSPTADEEAWPDHLAGATQWLSLVLIVVFAVSLLTALLGAAL